MVDEKEKDKEKASEKERLSSEAEPEAEVSAKPSLMARMAGFKKLLIPIAAAAGSFALAAVLFTFVLGDPKSEPQITQESATAESTIADSSAAPAHEQPAKSEKPQKAEKIEDSADRAFTKEDVAKMEIDTANIMKELDFLFYTPEMDEDVLGMTPKDSVDTLSWIQKEMASLIAEKKTVEAQKKELEELKYRIDQGLIKIEQAESSRIIKLARLYDGMKANEVAKLFANLSDKVIISLLPRMKPANASKILGQMPPKRAASLSTQMISVLED